jgi:hypothetical protein
VFLGADHATVYYLAGTTGWGSTFGGLPAVLWTPPPPVSLSAAGIVAQQFGFTISGGSNVTVVVEAATSLLPVWLPVGTNLLTNGSSSFSDVEWTNHPARFYRLRSP